MKPNPDLNKPPGLEPAGEKAYEVIMTFLNDKQTTCTGGCRAFYSPEQWKQRGEDPIDSDTVLVVVHDGGDLAPIFNIAYEQYDLGEEMRQKLAAHELWCEAQTCWFSVVHATRQWAVTDTTDHNLVGTEDGPYVFPDVNLCRAAATILNEQFGARARFRCIPYLEMKRWKKDEIQSEMSAEEAIVRIESRVHNVKNLEHGRSDGDSGDRADCSKRDGGGH